MNLAGLSMIIIGLILVIVPSTKVFPRFTSRSIGISYTKSNLKESTLRIFGLIAIVLGFLIIFGILNPS